MALFISYMFLMLVISITSTHGVNTKLMIDSDAGADDAMAIFIALNYHKYFNGPQVVALTTTHGNVDEDQALLNLQRILRAARRQEVPLYRGANFSLVQNEPTDNYYGTDGLGNTAYDSSPVPLVPPKTTHAVQALLDYSKLYEDCWLYWTRGEHSRGCYGRGTNPIGYNLSLPLSKRQGKGPTVLHRLHANAEAAGIGRLEVIALGVLTNIALAIRLDPLFLSRLHRLYIGAGNVYSETYPSAEFNALGDVEAYRAVLQSASAESLTLLPFSQVRILNITKEWRINVLGAIPTQLMRTQNEYESHSLNDGSALWDRLDPAVVAIAVNPSLVLEADYVDNNIITCGESRGINTNEVVSRQNANAELVQTLDAESYMDFLLQVFSVGRK